MLISIFLKGTIFVYCNKNKNFQIDFIKILSIKYLIFFLRKMYVFNYSIDKLMIRKFEITYTN